MHMPLNVRVEEKSKGVYTIYSDGSIDTNTYSVLRTEVDKILEKSPRFMIFDMKNVNYISSAGVGVILVAEQSVQAQGGGVMMVQLQPQIKKVFDIVQALPSEQIFASIEEMDRYLSEIQRKVKETES
jgi:anti-sigma B factor antagonist